MGTRIVRPRIAVIARIRSLGYRYEEELYRDLYERNGQSIRQIAKITRRSYGAVKAGLTRLGFALRPRGGPNHTKASR